MKKIILASGSARRHELLDLLGIPHLIIPCKEKEKAIENNEKLTVSTKQINSIKKQLLEVAKQKVFCVKKTLNEKYKERLILGADTIVLLEGEIIGKPKSTDDAVFMLQKLMGKVHDVYTGLFLHNASTNQSFSDIERTRVSMIPTNNEKIKAYLKAENVMDKAGAYAIQGKGAAFIDWIEGCYYNVMGLPLSKLVTLLEQAGYNYLE
jgi:septum formation protein